MRVELLMPNAMSPLFGFVEAESLCTRATLLAAWLLGCLAAWLPGCLAAWLTALTALALAFVLVWLEAATELTNL
jgi:hypothetical protein